jgi:hypothetical protein
MGAARGFVTSALRRLLEIVHVRILILILVRDIDLAFLPGLRLAGHFLLVVRSRLRTVRFSRSSLLTFVLTLLLSLTIALLARFTLPLLPLLSPLIALLALFTLSLLPLLSPLIPLLALPLLPRLSGLSLLIALSALLIPLPAWGPLLLALLRVVRGARHCGSP